MSTTSQFFSGGAVVKSVQRGVISITGTNTSATATITSVDTAKAELHFIGNTNNTISSNSAARIVLTNSTTITATRASATTATTTITWEIKEYN